MAGTLEAAARKIETIIDGESVSSLNLYILGNDDQSHDCRPFAIIENVRTDEAHRGRGYATANLTRAEAIAREAGCYKIMLCTGSSREEVHQLYHNAGYSSDVKTCYCKSLE